MPGEMAEDEPLSDSLKECRVNIHNAIMEMVQDSIYHRFTANAALCSDLSCLDSKKFNEIQKGAKSAPVELSTGKG